MLRWSITRGPAACRRFPRETVPLASTAHRTVWMVTEPNGAPRGAGVSYSGLAAGAGSCDGGGGGVEGGAAAGTTVACGMMNHAVA